MTSSRRPGLERKSETWLLPWFSLTPNQPTVLFSSSPLYHCSQFHGLSPLSRNFISQYILFPMLVRTWGARRLIPCPPAPLGKTPSTNSTLTPSPTFSLKTDWFHFPWRCPFSSTVSCYLSCLGSLCHFPVAVQGSTASCPLPHWWEPTVCPAAARSLLTSLWRTCLFLSGSWYRGHLHKEKALAVAFLLPPLHFYHLMCFKGE